MAILTPTISVADNGNGTGVVVTVTGATAGTTNTFWKDKIESNELVIPTAGSSRVGSGTIAQTLAVGHYLGVVVSTDGVDTVYSNYVNFHTTQYGTSDLAQIMTSIVDRVVSLSLTGLPAGRVFQDLLPFLLNKTYPCVIVSLLNSTDDVRTATNVRSDRGYAIRLDIVMRVSQQDADSVVGTYLDWREKIVDAFQDESLPGAAMVHRCTITPQESFSQEREGGLILFVSPFIIRAYVRR